MSRGGSGGEDRSMSELGDRIRDEAAVTSWPGSLYRLYAIAREVEAIETQRSGSDLIDLDIVENEARAEAARINTLADEAEAHGDESAYGVDEESFIFGAQWQAERAILGTWEYGRGNRVTGEVTPLSGPPLPEWFDESQDTHIHLRRRVFQWEELSAR